MKRFKMNAADKEQRIEAADVLKGIALIGILLINMPNFYSPASYYDNNLLDGSRMNYFANGLVDLVVGQTGYALLAILFGFGFMKMLSLRLGYITNNDDYGLTTGFGINKYGFALDYSYTPFDVFDNVNRVSIRFKI